MSADGMRPKISYLLFAAGALSLDAGPAVAQQTCVGEVEEMVEAVRAEQAWPQIEQEFSRMAGDASVLAKRGDEENCYAALADMRRYLIERDIIVADLERPPPVQTARSSDRETAAPRAQKPSDTTSAAEVTVLRSEPEVRIVESESSVSVVEGATSEASAQPEPNVRVVQPEPEVTVVQAEPSDTVRQEDGGPAEITTARAEPAEATTADISAILVQEVHFGLNESSISPDARDVLKDVVEAAGRQAGTRILLTGHADSTGPAAYNMALSKRRVDAVAEGLSALGVDPSRIETRYFGEQRPEVLPPQLQPERSNRRVDIRVLGPSG